VDRSAGLDIAFTPATLGPLTLRNRFIKAATFEGMAPGGVPSDDLRILHRAVAAGGTAMTTVAYCAVSDEGRTFRDQMVLTPSVRGPLLELTAAVHDEGALAAAQLGHAGFFSKHRIPGRWAPAGPSWTFNAYGVAKGMPLGRPMSSDDIRRTVADFARAAEEAAVAGFDALEVHLGHGYLLSQFLSPASNRRQDAYGGNLDNRLRFPLEALAAIRAAIGRDLAVVCKINVEDGFDGGLEVDESVRIAQALEVSGHVDGLVLSGGFTSRNALFLLRGGRPLAQMEEVETNEAQKLALKAFGPMVVQRYPFEENFFASQSRRIRASVKLPLIVVGGVSSAGGIAGALGDDGFEFVQLGRALVREPAFVRRLEQGDVDRSDCVRCNVCITEMDRPGGVRCVMPRRRKRVARRRKGPKTVKTVLVTGGLGEVGQAVTRELANRGLTVRVLERRNPLNEQRAAAFGGDVRVFWGDLRDHGLLAELVEGCDAVVHLASMLPSATETQLTATIDVNVAATDALVQLAPPLLVYASSYTVYGPAWETPTRPRHEDDPVRPTDMYTHCKVASEDIIRRSGVAYSILRLATIPPLGRVHVDPRLVLGQFRVRPDAPIEMTHPRDCALAFARVLETPAAWNTTLNIGGGPRCQITQRDMLTPMADILGWPDGLPPDVFGDENYYSQWSDTSRSVALLGDYQRHDWTDLRGALVEASIDDARPAQALAGLTRRVMPPLLRWARRFGTL